MSAAARFGVALAAFAALVAAMPFAGPLFAALFPWLERPLYVQQGFAELVVAHLALAAAATGIAALVGIAAGIAVTRPAGAPFRRLVETLSAIGQTVPPVAVLALAVPVIGFGFWPALAALVLYGLLPIAENAVAGIESVPRDVREAARGIGMSPLEILARVELPLAAPVILAGLRFSATVNIGTAAIASTVGAVSLGSPIIVGLNGNNIAYVVQGAVLAAVLAIVVDLGFEALAERLGRWRGSAVAGN